MIWIELAQQWISVIN